MLLTTFPRCIGVAMNKIASCFRSVVHYVRLIFIACPVPG